MHTHKGFITHILSWSPLFYKHKTNIIASKGTHISGAVVPFSMLIGGNFGVVLPKVNKEILIQTVDKYKASFTILKILGKV